MGRIVIFFGQKDEKRRENKSQEADVQRGEQFLQVNIKICLEVKPS